MKKTSILIFILYFCSIYLVVSAAETIDVSNEPYSIRPDILLLAPLDEGSKGLWTKTILDAHFTTVANLLSLYPSQDIYFLARDGEYLFDVAKIVTDGTSESTRIHLINVSTKNKSDPLLKKYLMQFGISEDAFESGKRAILIDSGFIGSIPKAIGELFSPLARKALKAHLLFSGNPEYPSSRTFLVHLDNYSTFLELDPRRFSSMMSSYEHLPHFTDRSTNYSLHLGRYEPMSPIASQDDGIVSKEKSIIGMRELVRHWIDPKTKSRFETTRVFADKLRFIVLSAKSRFEIEKVKDLIFSEPKNIQLVRLAQVIDFFEAIPNIGLKSRLRIEDLSVPLLADEIKTRSYNKPRTSTLNKCLSIFST